MNSSTMKTFALGGAAGMVFTAVGVAIGQSHAAPLMPIEVSSVATPAKATAPVTKKYVEKRIKTRAAAKIRYRKPAARSPKGKVIGAGVQATGVTGVPTVDSLAGTAVRSIVFRYTIPNNYGADGPQSLVAPKCPTDAPIEVGWGVHAANYADGSAGFLTGPVNSDGSAIAMYRLGNRVSMSFSPAAYPKSGDVDLYVSQTCAPTMAPVPVG